MKYLQRLGKSLMLPVACLPVAGILLGIGYAIDSQVLAENAKHVNLVAAFLVKAGSALIDNMAILFAVGVSVGMAKDKDGTAGLAGLVSWLTITTLLSSKTVSLLMSIPESQVALAFQKSQTQFIGILAGLIGAACYNRFKDTKLPEALAFFSGKRSVAIMTGFFSCIVSLLLLFIWPAIYTVLQNLGTLMIGTGSFGVGIYMFFNRLLIPLGLHHALNSVFWFDVAGINDIHNFWTPGAGVLHQTGMYMSGFFPVMMFGIPGAALAMYHTAKTKKKKAIGSFLLAASLTAFVTGVTEPLEFSFMFLAPGLYLVHAILTGLTGLAVTILGPRAGFNFSAGFIDYILSFHAPYAYKPWLLIPIGLVVGVIYYFVFRFLIQTFHLKTPGREDDIEEESKADSTKEVPRETKYARMALLILEGLGGRENIVSLDHCVTRLRLEVVEPKEVDDDKIKASGAPGIIKPGKNNVQVIIGTQVQFVAEELGKLLRP